jgi:hypothetical protein
MTAIVLAILRVVGLIWAIGAVFIMKNARAAGDSEAARWVFVGGALTFVAGLLLMVASRWAAIPAVLLVIQQGLFHWYQVRGLPPEVPRPPATQVVVAVLVAVATLILISKGALR